MSQNVHFAGTLVALATAGCSGAAATPPKADAAAGGVFVPDGGMPPAEAGEGGGDGAATCPTTVAPSPGTVVTASGAVTGVKSGATWAWKGIPYAAPPTGDLRFRPPRPAGCWTSTREATAYGPQCPQIDSTTQKVVGSEDCLTLNVWANEGVQGAEVLFFVHGGGNVQGSASDPEYDGSALAARTGAVVVTIEYRLGALGFLATTGLDAESPKGVSGNYGILDQIAALQWAKANIAAFGGSPDRVMLFGESAGGVNTFVHLASPLSKGLFSAATAESGGIYKTTLAEGITALASVVDTVGCSGASDVPSCLRGKTAEAFAAIPAAANPLQKGLHYGPLVDGWVLDADPLTVISRGAHNHVPVILGTNADETSRMVPTVKTDADYEAAVEAQYPAPPGAAAKLLARYPASSYASPEQALIALTTDVTWTCPIRRLARALASNQSEPVFRYHFTWTAPGPTGAVVGATHGIELPFVFQTFSAVGQGDFSPTASDRDLAYAIEGYWSRLAASGDPNASGAVSWPRYVVSTDPYLVLDTSIAPAAGLATANCDFIDTLVP